MTFSWQLSKLIFMTIMQKKPLILIIFKNGILKVLIHHDNICYAVFHFYANLNEKHLFLSQLLSLFFYAKCCFLRGW